MPSIRLERKADIVLGDRGAPCLRTQQIFELGLLQLTLEIVHHPTSPKLRWIFSRAIRKDERADVAAKVPPHCTYIIANVARHCADEWLQLADELERREATA